MAARASELELLPRFAPGCFRKVKRKVNTRYAQTPRLWQASLLASDRCLRFSQRFLRALPGCVRAGRVSSRCRGRSGRPEPGVPGGGRGRPGQAVGVSPPRSEAPDTGDKGAVRPEPASGRVGRAPLSEAEAAC